MRTGTRYSPALLIRGARGSRCDTLGPAARVRGLAREDLVAGDELQPVRDRASGELGLASLVVTPSDRDPRIDPAVGDAFTDRGERVEVVTMWTSSTGEVLILGTRGGEERGWTLTSWRKVMARGTSWHLRPPAPGG